MLRGRASGLGSPSAPLAVPRIYQLSMAMVWTVREQAVTKIEFFLDRAEALAAAGLPTR